MVAELYSDGMRVGLLIRSGVCGELSDDGELRLKLRHGSVASRWSYFNKAAFYPAGCEGNSARSLSMPAPPIFVR